jgi:2-oxoacid:acceptor oxidoreductase gamma subunit (pyruvate/2-ketoisovalerate family)
MSDALSCPASKKRSPDNQTLHQNLITVGVNSLVTRRQYGFGGLYGEIYFMQSPTNQTIQIRWHGRGGQGAITAAKVVAEAAFRSGYGGAVMAPTFGTERRGAPVTTSLKISHRKIYDLSPISTPDIVVVLDHMIMHEVDVTAGLKPGGWIILNSPRPVEEHLFPGYRTAVADVTRMGVEAGLRKGIVNTGIIGALGRASGLVDIETFADQIAEEFAGRGPEANALAARLVYDATQMFDNTTGGSTDA